MRIEDVVSNVKVYGLEESIKRSKYPMFVNIDNLNGEPTKTTCSLASCERGSGHDQFLTGIIVQFDLTFTNKAWVEAERYSFLDFVSSQSTMHRIARFDLDKQYISYVDERMIKIMQELKDEYNRLAEEGDTEAAKEAYLKLLYSNPAGFRITAGMTTNYRQLKTIYYQRKNHRLPEWKVFCEWIETLPMFKELVLGEKNGKDKNVLTNDGWIPVTEQMPKEYECTISNPELRSESRAIHFMASDVVQGTLYDPTNGKYYIREVRTFDGKWRSWGDKTIAKCKVIAWQPLPEPYRPEEKEEQNE